MLARLARSLSLSSSKLPKRRQRGGSLPFLLPLQEPAFYVGPSPELLFCSLGSIKRHSHDGAVPLVHLKLLNDYIKNFDLTPPSHEIAHLTNSHIGKSVTLHGYLGSRSDVSKDISFVTLVSKDLDNAIQVTSNTRGLDQGEAHHVQSQLRRLWRRNVPVAVTGVVQAKVKPKQPPTDRLANRNEEVEVSITALQILNSFPEDFVLQEGTSFPPEQRHLQLRQDRHLRNSLHFRHEVSRRCREFLAQERNFLEVETPLLFKSTPEGAREFLVPTRIPRNCYALPQSPQQYKQILMASGISKYFQIAKCFRDEDLRADRQPEFTQLDLEMSFAVGKDVMRVIEHLIRYLWIRLLGVDLGQNRFPRMPYEEAMSKYGSDKPDTRLGMELIRIGHLIPADLVSKLGPLTDPIVEGFKLHVSEDPSQTTDFISNFMGSTEALQFIQNPEGQPGIFIYDSRKPLGGLQPFGFEAAEQVEELLELEEGDVVVLQARRKEPFSGSSTPIGNLRLALNQALISAGLTNVPTGWNFLWVTTFPLFSPTSETDSGQGGGAGLASTHHPFTAPASMDDAKLLATDPAKAHADHYDLVLNGVELGGGSRRIHDANVQEYVLREVLKMSDERLHDFMHLIEVLRAGCPPHAGIALGFDRLVATMLGKQSIREVIAFPKTGSGEDPLVKSPSQMTQNQLDTYHLQLKR